MTTATTNTNTNTETLAMAIATAETNALAVATSATSWTTKAGRTVTRHSPIGALSAPKAVQINTAITATITQWQNGQFRPFLKDVRACLSDSQALTIAESITLSPTNRGDCEEFLRAAHYELTHKFDKKTATVRTVAPKGEKARIVSTILALEVYE